MFISIFFALMPAYAENVQYLDNAPKTMAAMYETIQTADKSLDLAYYEINPCDTSVKVLMKLIADRKRANPKLTVRVIADDYPLSDAGYSAERYARQLRSQRISFRIFNPRGILFNLRYDHRLHAKYMVADAGTADARLVTGSSNLTDTHFGMSHRGIRGMKDVNYIDRNVLVTGGDSAQAASAHFDEIWAVAKDPRSGGTLPPGCFDYGARERELEGLLKSRSESLVAEAQVHNCEDTEFVADTVDYWIESNPFDYPGGLREGMEAERQRQVESKPNLKATLELLKAGKDILIENFTYMPFYDFEEVLKEKRKSGHVTVYTNHFHGSQEPFEKLHNTYVGLDSQDGGEVYSIGTIDHPNQHWDFSPNSARYQNHSKVFVSRKGNDVAVSIGSFNLDARSYLLNIESGIFTYGCESLAAQVTQVAATLTESQDADQVTALRRRMKGYVEAPVKDPQQALWDLLNFFHQL